MYTRGKVFLTDVYMNPKLAVLFEKYQFSRKDAYDFMQIYNLMPDYKKVRAIENFEIIAQNISSLKQDLLQEHEILLWKTLETIESRILKNKKKSLAQNTHRQMEHLRSMI